MTTTGQVNYSLLKLYIDLIPNFNGDPNTLEVFLEHCDFLMQTYSKPETPQDPLNGFLVRAVVGKLSGNALMLVGSRPEVREWVSLKALLRLSFGDNRNLDCLVQELIVLRPYKNEPYINFGQRIQKSRSAIASKLISMNLPIEERDFKIKNYDELSLKTFIRGLSGRVQDMVRLRNPTTLELAISYVIEEENFALSQKQFLGQSSKSEPNFKDNVSKPRINFSNPYSNAVPQQNSFLVNNPFEQQNYFPQTSQFPSQPINLQHRQNAPQRMFYSDTRVFGPKASNASKQVNVFKPTGQQLQHKPEPMSISTRNSNFTQKQVSASNRNNYFKSNGPRNFSSQELHNIEHVADQYAENIDSIEQNAEYEDYSNGYDETDFELPQPNYLNDQDFTYAPTPNYQT